MSTKELELSGEAAMLVLAFSDMRQAEAAARALSELPDAEDGGALARALETAIAVCYYRPFDAKNKTGFLRKNWRPEREEGREVHRQLRKLRMQVYAHTDPAGGRKGSAIFSTGDAGEIGETVTLAEEWLPIPRGDLPAIIATCHEQAARFTIAAYKAAVSAAD